MIALIALVVASATPLQAMADVQTAVGACEAHMTNRQLAAFDPYGNDQPRAVQDMLARARAIGRAEARRLRLTAAECETIFIAYARERR
jgi:hypothetical protein